MKKYLLPSALILLLGLGWAIAQQINSSVQLSQDARGVYGVDTNQNLYLLNNRHLNAQPGLAAPAVGAGTGCAIGTNSTDFSGTVSGCTGSNNTINFGQTYGAAPRCIATSQFTTNGVLVVTPTVSQFSISASTNGPAAWNWICIGAS